MILIMKNSSLIMLGIFCSMLIYINIHKSYACVQIRNSFFEISNLPNDSIILPDCIKKLTKPSSKGIRSSIGGMNFMKIHMLNNRKKLYVFISQASIGCHINQPESNDYYNDSCKMVASFPLRFSIKQGFKPFMSSDYVFTDFDEAGKGDYPAYFAKLEKTNKEKNLSTIKKNPPEQFSLEKFFTISLIKEGILGFKKGDKIGISTKNGLKHYRNEKLLNTYKIIPQLIKEENRFVYFLGEAKRFIDVQDNQLLVSVARYENESPTLNHNKIGWKPSFVLIPKLP